MPVSTLDLGTLLQEFVNRISHRGGHTLAIMNTADVTLHQVLLMTRLRESGPCSISQLAETLGLSLPAGSQAIERLRRLGMVTRLEDPADRRRKTVATTKKAHALLDRLLQARSQEYAAGVAVLPAPLRDDLAKVLRKVLGRLP